VSDDPRPDPDALLASIQKEREAARRGRLKIFFGMCPGVGKTYAMLQAARQRQGEGVEVVIGVVETHGRKETEALLEGLAIVPRAQIEYRGATLEEMDLDAILLWHPPLAVVDELAHTNAPGSRHPKRYQDVLELLDAGIDVFTTVNVQHIESRADTVRQITGATVRETVPDSVLDVAHEIVLVDLTPEQLRGRLADGKVYLGDRATAAADNFFRESNLTALREMALRLVAEHVDRDLRELMRTHRIAGPWKSGDRLLVGLSASPFSEKLIRYTRRLAATMEASWIAANIETPRPLSEAGQTRLNRYIALARRLGAEVVTTAGTEVGETLLRLARQHNVTQIVIGKPQSSSWRRWLGPSPVDWLIAHSGEIDLHMIRSEAEATSGGAEKAARPAQPWSQYWVACGVAATVTVAGLAVLEVGGYWTVALLYLLAVVLAATRLRRRPTLLLAGLSAVLWNYLFIPPRFTIFIHEVHDFVMFSTFFIVALVLGHFTSRLREREQAERRGEERSTALYRVARALAASPDLAHAMNVVVEELRALFGASIAVLLREDAGLLAQPGGSLEITPKEESVANWAFQKKQPAGRGTDTLPEATALHLPLLAGDHAEGVLAVAFTGVLAHEQRELLDAIAAQLAVFIEKERAVQRSRATEVAAQSEKLQRTLFDSVSHELKTPIAALSAALEQPAPDHGEMREAVRRLTRTVDHLLDATRLESGLLRLHREWCDPTELVREAVQRADVGAHPVQLAAEPELPPVLVDAGLFTQALALLIANAVQHSPTHEAVEIRVRPAEKALFFEVVDRGAGLAPGEEKKVFEKFYRGAGRTAGGLGLGLSIARQLVEMHGGQIDAETRPAGGARFSIRLPRGETMRLPG
jgi:two-component system sensor histidine kinase KdpD